MDGFTETAAVLGRVIYRSKWNTLFHSLTQ